MRIGHGYDVHRFGDGNAIVLGGVAIPYHQGLVAHSDGDVLLHALCDALLGAAGLGDIGRHFPDTDPKFANANSRHLLTNVMSQLKTKGWQVGNADLTIIAQAPKMAAYIPQMQMNIADDVGASPDYINVKATTTEQLGFTGRKEGIAAHAVVLLKSI